MKYQKNMQENIETHYDIHDMDNPKMWKKVPMTIHIQEDDPTAPSGKRRLSYDVAYTEDYELVGCLRRWANEVNNRFPNIKLWITGPLMECISDNTADDEISVDIEETNKPLIDAFNGGTNENK